MVVIYADTLFVINFSMDFLALFVTGKTLGGRIHALRLALASALGALFATLAAIFASDLLIVRIVWDLAFAACAAAMCAISFDTRLLSSAIVFAAVNLGFGGIISALCAFLRERGVIAGGGVNSPGLLLVFGVIAGVCSLVYTKLRKSRRREAAAVIDGRQLHLLVDSGNLLCEPLSRRPVIFAKPESLGRAVIADIASLPDGYDPTRLRAGPTRSVTGARILYGYIPGSVEVEGRAVDALVVVQSGDYGGLDGIIPEILI